MEFNLFSGLIGLIIFALDVWAIAQIINSGADQTKKIIWIAVVALLPVLGLGLVCGGRNGISRPSRAAGPTVPGRLAR